MYVHPTIRHDLARARYSDMLREARQEQLLASRERPSVAERIRHVSAVAAAALRRPERRVERAAITAAV
jgi:hypothetical protein